jgi:hypothetical protein
MTTIITTWPPAKNDVHAVATNWTHNDTTVTVEPHPAGQSIRLSGLPVTAERLEMLISALHWGGTHRAWIA